MDGQNETSMSERSQIVPPVAEDLATAALLQLERDNWWRLLANSSNFFIVWRGPNFIYEVSNDVSDRIVGCNPIGRPVEEVVPDTRASGFIDLLTDVYERGTARSIDDFAVEVGGEVRYFQASYVARRGPTGAIDGVMGFGLDVTERVEERRIRKSREKDLARAVKVARVGFYDWNIESGHIELSSLFCELYRCTKTATADDLFATIHPDDLQEVKQEVERSLYVTHRYDIQHRVLHKDGTVLWLDCKGEVSLNGQGQPAHFFGTIRDITELKEATIAFRRAKQLNDRIIAQSPAGIALLRGETLELEKVNARWAALVPRHDYSNRPLQEIYGDLDVAPLIERLKEVYATSQPLEAKELCVHVPVDSGVHEPRYFNVAASQIRNEQDEPYGVVCQANEVTVEVLARAQLRRSIDLLRVERGMREQFVATLTHDLRTPLTAAKMSAESLLRTADRKAGSKKLLRIVRSVERAETMVRNLLDANRLQAGEPLHLRQTTVCVHELARQCIDELSELHNRSFVLQAEPPPPVYASVDQEALRRILDNLGGNAVKYGATDAPIVVSLLATEHEVTLAVANRGPAIPVGEQSHLFDPYRRAASHVGKQSGWGIGLSLVKGLTEAHGGRVELTSNEEVGTIFALRLPRGLNQSPAAKGSFPAGQKPGEP